MTNYSLKSVP